MIIDLNNARKLRGKYNYVRKQLHKSSLEISSFHYILYNRIAAVCPRYIIITKLQWKVERTNTTSSREVRVKSVRLANRTHGEQWKIFYFSRNADTAKLNLHKISNYVLHYNSIPTALKCWEQLLFLFFYLF